MTILHTEEEVLAWEPEFPQTFSFNVRYVYKGLGTSMTCHLISLSVDEVRKELAKLLTSSRYQKVKDGVIDITEFDQGGIQLS